MAVVKKSFFRRTGVRPGLAFGGVAGGLFFLDRYKFHHTIERSLLTFSTGIHLIYTYKYKWTLENFSDCHRDVAQRLVFCFKQNEGLYVKFGQALASMNFILPKEYQVELRTLHDRAKTFDVAAVEQIMYEEFGQTSDQIFQSFDPVPIASASVAQVHKAVLKDGTDVAVKVQKPNIAVQCFWDLAVFWLVLHILEYIFELPLIWSYQYVCDQLRSELDFRIEAENSEACRHELANCLERELRERVHVPPIRDDILSPRVLVSEWVADTVKINDGEGLARKNFDSYGIMKVATRVFAHQIFVTGNVHCDPHPGNLLVRDHPTLPGMQLVLLDHGLYVHLSNTFREQYCKFWTAIIRQDMEKIREISKGWGVQDADFFVMTNIMQPFRGAAGSLMGPDNGNGSNGKLSNEDILRAPTPAELVKIQETMKQRAKRVLADTDRFPRELIFIGRNINLIRSANWALGSVVRIFTSELCNLFIQILD